ncbi:hypothetical protein [Spirosoma flavus]
MTRSQLNPMPVYFDRYINLCDDVTLPEAAIGFCTPGHQRWHMNVL